MSTASLEALRRFFETSPAARKATAPLGPGAEVGLVLDAGPAHFTLASGKARVEEGPATEPDFTLVLPDEAVRRITAIEGGDVGAFGVAFFGLVLSKDPATKVRIRIEAPTRRLFSHGYLGVLALGGMKVALWLLANGVRNPKAAIDRLRGR
jgi:hypothetical protein